MPGAERVVLVTGAGRPLGGRIAARLAADPTIDRIIGVDTVPPPPGSAGRGRTEFVRADIRNPLIGKVLDQARVDTIVHPGPATGRRAREHAAGTAQLLAACEHSTTITRVVAGSTTAVYGSSRRDPAVFTEDQDAPAQLPAGPGRDAVLAETRLRAFARTRPDVVVSVLRLAELVGAGVDTWLTRYLTLPLVPVPLGHDPRLQLLHDTDAVEVFHLAATQDHPGVTNVAADGVVTLGQALRWGGRLGLPVPGPVVGTLGRAVRPLALLGDDTAFLSFGRVVDTTRLTGRLGFRPRLSTAAALRDFFGSRPGPAVVAGVRRSLVTRLGSP